VIVVASALLGTVTTQGAHGQDAVPLVAVDASTGGNGPRAVGSIEECVSAVVGQAVEVDIVVPAPGVPVNRGVAAYQFDLLYDPDVVWVQADDGDMLLDQAPGSNVIAIADPKPDSNGRYVSWGVDFGPSGIEPAGSSEVGGGVLARLTLSPRSTGASALTLSGVLIIDDEGQRIDLGAVEPGAIHVGGPCPGDGNESGPDPQASQPAPPADPATSPAATNATPQAADPAEAGAPDQLSDASIGGVPGAGGPPPLERGDPRWPIATGAAMAGLGAAILVGGTLVRRARATSLQDDEQYKDHR